MLNSARADLVQVDATNPSTMYIGFGSGIVWKTQEAFMRECSQFTYDLYVQVLYKGNFIYR